MSGDFHPLKSDLTCYYSILHPILQFSLAESYFSDYLLGNAFKYFSGNFYVNIVFLCLMMIDLFTLCSWVR